MGERGKAEDMKPRKTNLEPAVPADDKVEHPDPMSKQAHKPEVRLGREAQARIGQQLRDMYQTFVQEGVPDHLADLVQRLSEQE
jgi:hypothetical protein